MGGNTGINQIEGVYNNVSSYYKDTPSRLSGIDKKVNGEKTDFEKKLEGIPCTNVRNFVVSSVKEYIPFEAGKVFDSSGILKTLKNSSGKYVDITA